MSVGSYETLMNESFYNMRCLVKFITAVCYFYLNHTLSAFLLGVSCKQRTVQVGVFQYYRRNLIFAGFVDMCS